MDIKDRQDRKCLLLRAYINGAITINSVASEFPEIEKEVREFLSERYSIPVPAPKPSNSWGWDSKKKRFPGKAPGKYAPDLTGG